MVNRTKRCIENLEKGITCVKRAERNREMDKIKDKQERSAFNAAINILNNILGEITNSQGVSKVENPPESENT